MGNLQDLTGKQYGRLTVIKRAENKGNLTMWQCICKCGREIIVSGGHLKDGHTQSCGCLSKEFPNRKTHGATGTRLFKIWRKMKERCLNPNSKDFKNYGGRGITVCAEWLHDFQNFCDWAMNNGYADNLTLDRIDVNGNYEPSNCRWATRKEQSNNKRNNHFLICNGKTQTLAQWEKETGLPRSTILRRLKNGASEDEALGVKKL